MPVKRYVVKGRVQGVGYRYFAQSTATQLGIHGFVRILSDGSVEVEAEGSVSALEDFAAELAQGPLGSRVEDVVESEPLDGGSYTSFLIRG